VQVIVVVERKAEAESQRISKEFKNIRRFSKYPIDINLLLINKNLNLQLKSQKKV